MLFGKEDAEAVVGALANSRGCDFGRNSEEPTVAVYRLFLRH